MGLRDGHPEKEGVLVDLNNVATEVKQRLKRKSDLEGLIQEAEGLRVVDGIKSEAEVTSALEDAPTVPETVPVPDTEKPKEETPVSQEAIGAVPAS